MASFVMDASAALPWCFEDEATVYTEGLLNRCAAGEEIMVASIWPLEMTNSLLGECAAPGTGDGGAGGAIP